MNVQNYPGDSERTVQEPEEPIPSLEKQLKKQKKTKQKLQNAVPQKQLGICLSK